MVWRKLNENLYSIVIYTLTWTKLHHIRLYRWSSFDETQTLWIQVDSPRFFGPQLWLEDDVPVEELGQEVEQVGELLGVRLHQVDATLRIEPRVANGAATGVPRHLQVLGSKSPNINLLFLLFRELWRMRKLTWCLALPWLNRDNRYPWI